MRDLNEIQCFVKAVELKSLTAASKALELPKSSVSRKISELEKRLGMTLLIRTTRALNLTDAGKDFYNKTLSALQEIEQAEKGLDKSRQKIDGLLRVTAPVEFAMGPFPKMVSSFLKEYPLVSIELILTERVVDLVGEGVDVGFRMGELEDSSLVAKKLKPFNASVVASAQYLKKRGEPRTPTDIEDHEWVKFSPDGVPVNWTLKSPEGKKTITPQGRFSANHMFALRQAALDGLGFAIVPNHIIEDDLKNKDLQIVCPKWELQGGPAHIVYPAQKFLSLKLRTFIDFAMENFNL